MDKTNFAPIVLFSYNRPYYLRQTLEALSKNHQSQYSRLYIYCDGPKYNASKDDLNNIAETRFVAKEKKWCLENVIIEREHNLGLSNSVISGINELFEKHDKIIVLEDDLITSPYFLTYMNTALDLYKDIDDVISIVGYNYPINLKNFNKDTYFINNADCWGWGTWKRGWSFFEKDANILINQIESKNATHKFNFNDNYPYMTMLKSVANGKIDSWAIRWYASAFVHEKLTLFPKKSLIRNIGNLGTHFKVDNSDLFGFEISGNEVKYYESDIYENEENWLKLSAHFRRFNRRRFSVHSLKYAFKRIFFYCINVLFKQNERSV